MIRAFTKEEVAKFYNLTKEELESVSASMVGDMEEAISKICEKKISVIKIIDSNPI